MPPQTPPFHLHWENNRSDRRDLAPLREGQGSRANHREQNNSRGQDVTSAWGPPWGGYWKHIALDPVFRSVLKGLLKKKDFEDGQSNAVPADGTAWTVYLSVNFTKITGANSQFIWFLHQHAFLCWMPSYWMQSYVSHFEKLILETVVGRNGMRCFCSADEKSKMLFQRLSCPVCHIRRP